MGKFYTTSLHTGIARGVKFSHGSTTLQGGVTPIEPVQTLLTGGFDRLDRPLTANFFFGPTFDLENFPTSGVKGRFLLEATPPVGHLLLQLRSSTHESHKATTRTALLNR